MGEKREPGDRTDTQQDFLGQYRLVQRLAVGGMAEIFLAQRTGVLDFRKTVVIKRIRPEFAQDLEFTKMFVDEARISAKLSHSNIAQVFDLGQSDGQLFLAMEYIEGLDCAKLLDSSSPLAPAAAVAIVVHALRGLQYAHGKRVLHRDVSPQNILVGIDGAVKITDFGIARATNRLTQTMPGIVKGKLAYMAPEQAEGGTLDHRTDLFACALTGYELLSGTRAYSGQGDLGVIMAIRNHSIQPLHDIESSIPKRVSAVFDTALAADPAKRFSSCARFADALLSACAGWVEPMSPDALGQTAKEALGIAPTQTFIVTRQASRRLSWPTGTRVAMGAVLVAGLAFFALKDERQDEIPTPPTLDQMEPSAAPSAIPPPPPPSDPANPTNEVGYLTINSGPWGYVFVDDRKLTDTTPIYRLALPPGRHRVRVQSPGAGKSEEMIVDIERGKTVTRIVRFR